MTTAVEIRAFPTERERERWRVPRKLTVSEWAEQFRVLNPKTSAEPGPWRTNRTPYLREIMDSFTNPDIEEINLMACTQVGKTEGGLLNPLGYFIDQDPCPMLIVRPDKETTREFSKDRVRPMIESTPCLQRQIKGGEHEDKKLEITWYEFRRNNVYFAWAGGAAALASRPIRVVFMDEVDKYPKWSGREADPEELAQERAKTFWNRKIARNSSPSTTHGNIWQAWLRSLKHRYYVPCPYCGQYQWMHMQQLKWPADERDPQKIKYENLAWYECEGCGSRWNDADKVRANMDGEWRVVDEKGNILANPPMSRVIAYQLNCFSSPWVTFSEIAAKFLESKDDPAKLMNFVNSWLAEPWEDKVEEAKEDELRQHKNGLGRGVVPDWAKALTAGVDVQKSVFYIAVHAWGAGETSAMIDEYFIEGGPDDWGELERRLADAEYRYESAEAYGSLRIALAGIDSAYRTDEVYEFCRTRGWCRAIKGDASVASAYAVSLLDRFANGKAIPGGLKLWRLNTDLIKEKIHRALKRAPGQPGYWGLHDEVGDDYLRQFCAEHQVKTRPKTRAGVLRSGYQLVWTLRAGYSANHYLDCGMIATAMAMMLGVRALPHDSPPGPVIRIEEAKRERHEAKGRWIERKPGWVRR